MFNLNTRTILSFLTVGFMMWIWSEPAFAQTRVGVRGGISADPEQIYFGGHVDASEIVERFWFRPNVEVGFGDSRTLATFNAEFVYRITTRKEWNPYFGGGPALVLQTVRSGGRRDTDVGPGFNFVAGIEQNRGLMAEIKIGALDSPGFKLGIGWTW
jgi:hypothetical protein